MNMYTILAGEFKLDGGAMFGVVPKTIWNRAELADSNNLVSLAMRCLLIELDEKLILIDTGIGNKLPKKIAPYYHINPSISLEKSIQEKGFSMNDITDVVLSHLHLDHAGGAITINAADKLVPSFPNATYWSSLQQWEWATHQPNPRESASFRAENLEPLQQSQQLKMIEQHPNAFPPQLEFLYANGHTKGMLMPLLQYKQQLILFAADLLPSIYHIPIPYIPAYDIDPIISMEEKKSTLNMCVEKEAVIFLDHDFSNECCTLKHTEKGIVLDQTFDLVACL